LDSFAEKSSFGLSRRNLPDFKQHFLKAVPGSARTQIVASEFFEKLFFSSNDPQAVTNFDFGWEAFAALTAPLERRKFRSDS
jgi:hypothetical protein